jgi:hypothetical protein
MASTTLSFSSILREEIGTLLAGDAHIGRLHFLAVKGKLAQ